MVEEASVVDSKEKGKKEKLQKVREIAKQLKACGPLKSWNKQFRFEGKEVKGFLRLFEEQIKGKKDLEDKIDYRICMDGVLSSWKKWKD